MDKSILEVLYHINSNRYMDNKLLSKAMNNIINLEDSKRDFFLGSIFTGLMTRNPNIDEVTTLIKSAFSLDSYNRDNVPKHSTNKTVVEYIGSGKKGIKTFNISTISAITAVATGACVLKKGSSATSSVTGSADFMSILGVKQLQNLDKVNDSLDKIGFAFVGIENVIPKFNKVYNGKFFSPNILSFGLAALITPLRGDIIMYGLAHQNVNLCMSVLKYFSVKDAMVISSTHDGIHYIDEIGICGNVQIKSMNNGICKDIVNFNPTDILNENECKIDEILQKNDPFENIKTAIKILYGKGTRTQTNIVALNAANILYAAGVVNNLKEGIKLAKEKIYDKSAIRKLKEYIEFSGGSVNKLNKILMEI